LESGARGGEEEGGSWTGEEKGREKTAGGRGGGGGRAVGQGAAGNGEIAEQQDVLQVY